MTKAELRQLYWLRIYTPRYPLHPKRLHPFVSNSYTDFYFSYNSESVSSGLAIDAIRICSLGVSHTQKKIFPQCASIEGVSATQRIVQ